MASAASSDVSVASPHLQAIALEVYESRKSNLASRPEVQDRARGLAKELQSLPSGAAAPAEITRGLVESVAGPGPIAAKDPTNRSLYAHLESAEGSKLPTAAFHSGELLALARAVRGSDSNSADVFGALSRDVAVRLSEFKAGEAVELLGLLHEGGARENAAFVAAAEHLASRAGELAPGEMADALHLLEQRGVQCAALATECAAFFAVHWEGPASRGGDLDESGRTFARMLSGVAASGAAPRSFLLWAAAQLETPGTCARFGRRADLEAVGDALEGAGVLTRGGRLALEADEQRRALEAEARAINQEPDTSYGRSQAVVPREEAGRQ